MGVQVDTEQFDDFSVLKVYDTLLDCLNVVKTGKFPEDNYAGDYRLLAPYGDITDLVAKGLDIRLETVVNTVDYSGKEVTVQAGSKSSALRNAFKHFQ